METTNTQSAPYQTIFGKLSVEESNLSMRNKLRNRRIFEMLQDWEFISSKVSLNDLDSSKNLYEKINTLLREYQEYSKGKEYSIDRSAKKQVKIKKSSMNRIFRSQQTVQPNILEDYTLPTRPKPSYHPAQNPLLYNPTPIATNETMPNKSLTQRIDSSFEKILSLKANKILEQNKSPALIQKKEKVKKDEIQKKSIIVNRHKFSYSVSDNGKAESFLGMDGKPLIFSRKVRKGKGESIKMNDSKDSFNHLIYDNKFMKYFQKFKKEDSVVNHMTKYLKNVLGLSPPNFREIDLLNSTSLEGNKTVHRNRVQVKKSHNETTDTFNSFYTASNCITVNNYSTRASNNNSPSMKERLKDVRPRFNIVDENRSGIKGKFAQIYNTCEKQLEDTEKLYKENSGEFMKEGKSIRKSLDKIFSVKDKKLEKVLAKEALTEFRQSGNFIYGNKTGYYLSNAEKIKDIKMIKRGELIRGVRIEEKVKTK